MFQDILELYNMCVHVLGMRDYVITSTCTNASTHLYFLLGCVLEQTTALTSKEVSGKTQHIIDLYTLPLGIRSFIVSTNAILASSLEQSWDAVGLRRKKGERGMNLLWWICNAASLVWTRGKTQAGPNKTKRSRSFSLVVRHHFLVRFQSLTCIVLDPPPSWKC